MLPWKQPGLRPTLTLEAAGCGFLRVHLPPGEPFFCVGPIPARPDAFDPLAPDRNPVEPGEWRRIGLQPRIWQE